MPHRNETSEHVSAYTFFPSDEQRAAIRVERTHWGQGFDLQQDPPGGKAWAIRRGASCLNRAGEWEYEPLPSSRDTDFCERCRYDREEAIQIATRWSTPTLHTPKGEAV